MKRILVAGYYGFGNAGDEAILSGMLFSLKEGSPDLTFTVVSGDPQETRHLFGVDAVHWQDIPALIAAAEASDLIITGGGGLFQDYWGVKKETYLTSSHGDITFYGAFPLLANLFQKPCMTYAVGIGPLRTPDGDEHTQRALRQCDVITVRDPQSKRIAERAGTVVLSADPAFALRPASSLAASVAMGGSHRGEKRPILGVSARHWGSPSACAALFESLATSLDHFLEETSGQVLFLPLQHAKSKNPLEDDVRASEAIRQRMKHAERTRIVTEKLRPEVLAAVLRQCDAVLGMRLHAVLLALAGGVAAAGIAYDPKVSRVFDDAGLEFLSVAPEEASPDRLTPLLLDLVQNPARTREAVLAFSERQQALAAIPAAHAINLLSRPAAQPSPRNVALADFIKDLVPHRQREGGEIHRLTRELSGLSASLSEKDRRIETLQGETASEQQQRHLLAEELDSLRRHAANLESDKTSLTNRVHSLEEELTGIYQSNGWKFLIKVWNLKRRLTGRQVEKAPEAPGSTLAVTSPGIAPAPAPVASLVAGSDVPTAVRSMTDHREELGRILGANEGRRPIVVFPPSVGWDIPLFQRPQQMAIAYARLGCLVFYCDYECTLGKGFHEIQPRLFRCDVPVETFGEVEKALLIILSYNRHWIPYFKDPVVIYEFIDDLDVFTVDDREQLGRDHDQLLSESAIVVATARRLWETVLAVRPDALLCPNGVDYDHFLPAQGLVSTPPPHDLLPFLQEARWECGALGFPMMRAKTPLVGYYGALARWFDYELLRQTARLRPAWNFLLIGPPYDFSFEESGVKNEPNVHWLGQKPYRTLPEYLRYFDAAIIPFVLNPITHATSPLKLFEYMAAGKPVVTTPMEESVRFSGVLTAATPEAFATTLEEALRLGDNPGYRQTIDRVARENTWEERARSILEKAGFSRGEN